MQNQPSEKKAESLSAIQPDTWAVSTLGSQGASFTLDGFVIRLSNESTDELFDFILGENEGLVETEAGFWIKVYSDSDTGEVIIKPISKNEKINGIYPNGVILPSNLLKALGIEQNPLSEGLKMAYKKSGKKMKRGFRVTSGIRKGRVVTNIRTAFKPRAKASTRAKLRLARRKKKAIRIMKSKRTRRKSLSKRVARMNAARK